LSTTNPNDLTWYRKPGHCGEKKAIIWYGPEINVTTTAHISSQCSLAVAWYQLSSADLPTFLGIRTERRPQVLASPFSQLQLSTELCEWEKRKLRGVVRDTTVLEGGVIEIKFDSFEGSQAVPASPSGRGEACIRDSTGLDWTGLNWTELNSESESESLFD
jgi:hypothetical protein